MSRQWHQSDHSIHVVIASQGLQADSFLLLTAAFRSGMCQKPSPLRWKKGWTSVQLAAPTAKQAAPHGASLSVHQVGDTCMDQHCSAPSSETRREPQLRKARTKYLTLPIADTNPV